MVAARTRASGQREVFRFALRAHALTGTVLFGFDRRGGLLGGKGSRPIVSRAVHDKPRRSTGGGPATHSAAAEAS